MKGFKKDGKFRPTGNKSKSSLSKQKLQKRNEVSFALSKNGRVAGKSHDGKNSNTVEHGFDLTDFEPNGFQKVLKGVGIPVSDGKYITKDYGEGVGVVGYGYVWEKDGLMIITSNNPITGEYNNPKQRENEKDYASYMGIEGDEDEVAQAVKLIKEYSGSKDESVGRRDFIWKDSKTRKESFILQDNTHL